ncbi:MAG: RNA 2'-phosphotransferase [Synergistaceae bacterium]|nr:RNA 2'-phosphotransferase [Synergistaceae bacterium]
MAKEKHSSLSRLLSKILRHEPEIAGITLDSHGWAKVSELIEGVNKIRPIDIETLREIVATDRKGRYSLSEDGEFIRANQGHSVEVDVELEEREPPELLYHGTSQENARIITAEGLKPMTRLYVHLSKDYPTAVST